MRKKILAFLLSFALALTMFPMLSTAAYADIEGRVEVTGATPVAGEAPYGLSQVNVVTPGFSLQDIKYFDAYGEPWTKAFVTGKKYQVRMQFKADENIVSDGGYFLTIDGKTWADDEDYTEECIVDGDTIIFRVSFWDPAKPKDFDIYVKDNDGSKIISSENDKDAFRIGSYNAVGAVTYEWRDYEEDSDTAPLLLSNKTGKFTPAKLGYNYGSHKILVYAQDEDNNQATITLTMKCYYDLNKATIKVKDVVYNGKSGRTPGITIKAKLNGKTKTLTKGTDYKLTYKKAASKRKNVGTYSFMIEPKDTYLYYYYDDDTDGEFDYYDRSFKILPKGTAIKSVKAGKKSLTVKWNKQSKKMATKRITGYQVQVATNKAFTANKVSKKIKGYKNVKATIKKLKGGKKYYVHVRTYKVVNGVTCYSKWSKVKTKTTKK